MTYYNINSLIQNHNYIPTEEFNGMTTNRRRQVVTVVEAALVPADWSDNPNIIGRAIVEGKRGARYSANITKTSLGMTFNIID